MKVAAAHEEEFLGNLRESGLDLPNATLHIGRKVHGAGQTDCSDRRKASISAGECSCCAEKYGTQGSSLDDVGRGVDVGVYLGGSCLAGLAPHDKVFAVVAEDRVRVLT